jgi:hypothetical protein
VCEKRDAGTRGYIVAICICNIGRKRKEEEMWGDSDGWVGRGENRVINIHM